MMSIAPRKFKAPVVRKVALGNVWMVLVYMAPNTTVPMGKDKLFRKEQNADKAPEMRKRKR